MKCEDNMLKGEVIGGFERLVTLEDKSDREMGT